MPETNISSVISIIGMTGTGKTTVGKILAEKLNYDFFDIDEIITQKTRKNPAEIFELYGEETFRKIETEELSHIFKNYNNKNFILSCGGGIVLKKENREMLKKNSFVIWLLRPVEEIIKNGEILKRPPINNSVDNYIKIFKERESLYAEICDLKIEYTDFFKSCREY